MGLLIGIELEVPVDRVGGTADVVDVVDVVVKDEAEGLALPILMPLVPV